MQLDGSKGFKIDTELALYYTALIRYESKFPFYLSAALHIASTDARTDTCESTVSVGERQIEDLDKYGKVSTESDYFTL